MCHRIVDKGCTMKYPEEEFYSRFRIIETNIDFVLLKRHQSIITSLKLTLSIYRNQKKMKKS